MNKDNPILNDYVFKHVFGKQENEKILISFLNAMLNGDFNITKAKVITPELPRPTETARTVLLDTLVQIDDGSYIDIEVQRGYRFDLLERMLIYGARMLSEYSQKATRFNSTKCIAIWILDCSMPEFKQFGNEPIIGTFDFRSETNKSNFLPLKGLRIYPIELKKEANIKNITTFKETWINFLKNSTDVSKPEEIEEIHDAYYRMMKITGSEEYRAYRYALDKDEEIRRGDIENARKEYYDKGISDGLQKGKKEGEHNAKLETAKKMLSKGSDVDFISECTGLSIEEIKELQE